MLPGPGVRIEPKQATYTGFAWCLQRPLAATRRVTRRRSPGEQAVGVHPSEAIWHGLGRGIMTMLQLSLRTMAQASSILQYGWVAAGGTHNAPGQALGYVYQVGWGLLELVRPGAEDQELRLESVDDVSWHDVSGDPLVALQVKHHLGQGNLSDASPDLWRTIKVWLDDPGLREPNGPQLVLVTTQAISAGSALSLLGLGARDEERARIILDETARQSSNLGTSTARQAWLAQSQTLRQGILSRLRVSSSQASADELKQQLIDAMKMMLPVGQEDLFTETFLGWWWTVAVDMLAQRRKGVRRLDLRLRLDDLRTQFSLRDLPTTVSYGNLPESITAYQDRLFIGQLELIGAGEQMLLLAVRDYYKAYTQMQIWLENKLTDVCELEEYEARLVHEWQMQFELKKMTLGENASEAEYRRVGLDLLSAVMNLSPSLLRADFRDPYFSRGTSHRLADAGMVGWHPEFRDRLSHLLEGYVA